MEKFNRQRQREVLTTARDAFPAGYEFFKGIPEETAQELLAEIRYLEGHGLLKVEGPRHLEQKSWEVRATITSKGIDFLEDDGGLSAILGVVTIKLHDDTIKSLIEAKILASDMPQPDKKRWLDQLRSLPADATKHLVLKLVDLGLDSSPSALHAIGKLLGQVAGA